MPNRLPISRIEGWYVFLRKYSIKKSRILRSRLVSGFGIFASSEAVWWVSVRQENDAIHARGWCQDEQNPYVGRAPSACTARSIRRNETSRPSTPSTSKMGGDAATPVTA